MYHSQPQDSTITLIWVYIILEDITTLTRRIVINTGTNTIAINLITYFFLLLLVLPPHKPYISFAHELSLPYHVHEPDNDIIPRAIASMASFPEVSAHLLNYFNKNWYRNALKLTSTYSSVIDKWFTLNKL